MKVKVKKTVFVGASNTEGHLSDELRGQILAFLRRYPHVPLDITFTAHDGTRSAKANAYYWSQVVEPLAKENEQVDEDFHDAMCAMFLPNESKRVEFFNKMTGESLSVDVDGRRSSKLTGGPFYDFVERVRLWGVEFLGVTTEDPDPLYWRKRGKSSAAGRPSEVCEVRDGVSAID